MAEALYRKYRPQTFEDVVGQDHIERTLKNAIQADKVSHAYLFTGPRGTGKTTTARLLAKALLCEKGPTPDPDGTCEDCTLIASGEHPDVYELDAASRTGVENVREEIIGRVNYAPTRGRYKVYIIDEVHMLSTAAFNALLKTLEEPPSHVVFILCTTDPQKVPETIHSRCQRFDFRRIASEELISRLGAICEMEGIEFEGDALDLIAHRAQGGMRDALTSLEQLIAFSDGHLTTSEAERLLGSLDSSDLASIVEAIGKRDAAKCFRWSSEYVETGADLAQFANDLASHVRDMYVLSLAGEDVPLDITETARKEMESELTYFGPDRLSRLLEVLGDLISELKTSTNQRLSFEIALTRMIRPESDITLQALAERVESLERALSGGVLASVSPSDANALVGNGGASISGSRQSDSTDKSVPSRAIDTQSAFSGQPAVSGGSVTQARASDGGNGDAAGADSSLGVSLETVAEHIPAANGQMWDRVVSNIKKISEPFGLIFMDTRAVRNSKGLRIEFNPNNTFAFNAARKQPEIRDAVKQALAQVGFADIAFEFVQAQEQDFEPRIPLSDAKASQNADTSSATGGLSASAVTDSNEEVKAMSAAASASQSQAQASSEVTSVPDAGTSFESGRVTEKATVSQDASFSTSSTSGTKDENDDASDIADQVPAGPVNQAIDGIASDGKNVGESANSISDVLSSTFGDGIVLEEID